MHGLLPETTARRQSRIARRRSRSDTTLRLCWGRLSAPRASSCSPSAWRRPNGNWSPTPSPSRAVVTGSCTRTSTARSTQPGFLTFAPHGWTLLVDSWSATLPSTRRRGRTGPTQTQGSGAGASDTTPSRWAARSGTPRRQRHVRIFRLGGHRHHERDRRHRRRRGPRPTAHPLLARRYRSPPARPGRPARPSPRRCCPRPSRTPATKASPGPRSDTPSASPPTLPHAATDPTNDQLGRDHPHNAESRTSKSPNGCVHGCVACCFGWEVEKHVGPVDVQSF